MSTKRGARLRRVHVGAWYMMAAALVLVAIAAVVLAQLALPWVERHPRTVERWLSERTQRPVTFDTLDTRWTRRGPMVRVTGLRIGEPDVAVPVDSAEIQLAPYSGLLPGRSLTELRLHGLSLTLQREDDGRWQVRGLPGQGGPDEDPLSALEGLGELQIVDARLALDAPSLSLSHVLPRVDLRMRVDRRRVRAAAQAWVEADGAPLDLRLELVRASGEGRAYVAMPHNDLQVWSPLLAATGVAIDEGRGRLAAWLDLQERRVVSVTVDAAMDALTLRRADAATDGAQVAFDGVRARLHWRPDGAGWRLDAPLLRVGHAGREQTLDGLAIGGGSRWALRAARVDVAPLVALATLGPGVSPGLRGWLRAAAPQAVLTDVEFAAQRDGRSRLSARVESLGFSPVGDRPGLHGLAGRLAGDATGVVFRPDPAARPVFDWPSGFGVAHPLRLEGGIVGWRDGDAWHVATPALRVEGEGYAADARGGLRFDGDRSRPRMDLAVRVDTAQVPVAKKFWVRHSMPAAAREWLDMALVAGEVRDGRAVVAGDLDDWPFDARRGGDRRGTFAAQAQLHAATIRFQDDWPAVTGLSGRVRFVNDGFALEPARGELAGVPVTDLVAGMRHYDGSAVEVAAASATDAGRLLALMRASPFQADHGALLDALEVTGPARVAMSLSVPPGAPLRLDGRVNLAGVGMRETRFDLAFSDVHGDLRFNQAGFAAPGLAVRQAPHAGVLSLRAGAGHVRDRNQAFEGELELPMAASALLARAPDLGWLAPHVEGTSPWRVQVTVPDAARSNDPGAARLLLRSDLVGTALRLPSPLDKPARTRLRTTIEAALPFDGGDIAVAFGERLAVRARSRGEDTGVRLVFGAGRVLEAPPARGLAIGGRTPVIDLVDWLGLSGGRGGGEGDGVALQSLDLTTGDLRLPGGRFGQTRLTAARGDAGIGLRLDGAALAGDIHLPDSDGAPVVAALQRLHWPAPAARPAPAAPRAPAATPARAAVTDELDPASLPPIEVTIDELRYGGLELGSATARSHAIPGGMQVEHLRIRAPRHRIEASGRWTGRGDAARTAVAADVESEDFGRLLSGLGFAGSIVGGQGRVDVDTAWAGSPAGFDIATLQGAMALTVKDGQLVEVDPGAGRVLGLLSITELPRRLSLDFRDFFSRGFGFSRLAGQVRFGDGQAHSDSLVIDGPAAEIRIRGVADLRARTHDQDIEVRPKTGNLLPAVGALTAGPVGAAVGAVANAVLRRPLAEVGARTYHVSGPWDDPDVEVVERTPPPVGPPAPGN